MIELVSFAVAGLLWLYVLVAAIRRPDERRWIRITTYVGLGLIVPAVVLAYVLTTR